jgi:hypothetical protein
MEQEKKRAMKAKDVKKEYDIEALTKKDIIRLLEEKGEVDINERDRKEVLFERLVK